MIDNQKIHAFLEAKKQAEHLEKVARDEAIQEIRRLIEVFGLQERDLFSGKRAMAGGDEYQFAFQNGSETVRYKKGGRLAAGVLDKAIAAGVVSAEQVQTGRALDILRSDAYRIR